MAVKSKEEIMESLRESFSEQASDSVLSILEDVSDTLDDFENKISDETDWKTKYEENDEMWRNKYKERFFSAEENTGNQTNEDEETENKPKTFQELFKVEE